MIFYISSLFTCCQTTNNNDINLSAISVRISSLNQQDEDGQLGIDSHVDRSCAGRHTRIIGIEEGKTSTAYPFNDSMKRSKRVKNIHVAYAHETENDTTDILRVNNCLDFTDTMHRSILCTNQARANAVIINDYPRLYDKTSTQSVIIPDLDHHIPIEFNGPVSFVSIRYPTDEEWDTCPHIHLTPEEGWEMNLIPLSHKTSSVQIDENIVDLFLLQQDLLDCL